MFCGQFPNRRGIEKLLFSDKLKFHKQETSQQNKIFCVKRHDDGETFSYKTYLCNLNQLSGASLESRVKINMEVWYKN